MEFSASGDLLSVTQSELPPFRLERPTSITAAVAALAGAEPPVAIYAGGTDFFAKVRTGLRPASLISLARVEEMKTLRRDGDALIIGALVTHFDGARDPLTRAVPGLAEAWRQVATVRIRRQATLGGNLMARHTRYEMSILLTALGASAHMAGPNSELVLPVEDLWAADLTAHPLLVAVSLRLAGAPRLDYERTMRPAFTQAAVVRDEPGGPHLRLVMGTEYLRPWYTDMELPTTATDVMSKLPPGFADPMVGNAYLRRVGAALLGRQLQRLEGV